MEHLLVGVGVLAALAFLHRAALLAERRGWIYYRNPPPRGAASLAYMRVAELFEPEVGHVIEALEHGDVTDAVDLDGLVVDDPDRPL